MCSITISAASKESCLNNGMQTKGNANRKFALTSLLQVTKSAVGRIANKSIGTGMTKSASGGRIKMCDGDKEDNVDGDGGVDNCLG